MNAEGHARFESAVKLYRKQTLDAIALLEQEHPFSAMTLGLCAVDLLANIYFGDDEVAFKNVVRAKLAGYHDEPAPEMTYELRCGLVHEFRTGQRDCPIAITDGVQPPTFHKGVFVFYVQHFCDAVAAAFEQTFRTADDQIQRNFLKRTHIYLLPLADQTTGTPERGVMSHSTITPMASSTSALPNLDERRFSR